jgi:hypothetical protein
MHAFPDDNTVSYQAASGQEGVDVLRSSLKDLDPNARITPDPNREFSGTFDLPDKYSGVYEWDGKGLTVNPLRLAEGQEALAGMADDGGDRLRKQLQDELADRIKANLALHKQPANTDCPTCRNEKSLPGKKLVWHHHFTKLEPPFGTVVPKITSAAQPLVTNGGKVDVYKGGAADLFVYTEDLKYDPQAEGPLKGAMDHRTAVEDLTAYFQRETGYENEPVANPKKR